jgi:DNA topoisomerase-3
VVDQYNKVQSFVSEPFWYINVAIERENEVDPSKTDVVEFKWRRNHLFDLEVVTALYDNCVDEPMATVLSVDTKPTTKWSVNWCLLTERADRQETSTSNDSRAAAIWFAVASYDPKTDPRCELSGVTQSPWLTPDCGEALSERISFIPAYRDGPIRQGL